MKYALAALVLLLIPAAGHAQSIDDATLQLTFDECVNSCQAAHAGGFCNEICGCMTGEIGRHWDEEDFLGRVERLQADAADPDVRAELDRLAQYCAARIE